ncbi:hypothetical protein BCR33DRAFT_771412 [Rhizoclosmatium globosum]|uniref:Uncharacterized protein n=1 Tax=Rhizoclosmatium globosum TaxID=329046 RepID=A0A1Y2BD40_9FUNG|nr:hypothetical protein BCR33DRAFT_771412 [Rhizoclosmatium globosum]|eukprot:ORY32407.1 hypothetical protein BCR33DRAFT_771412 [Rhizoclosmatium globosum]
MTSEHIEIQDGKQVVIKTTTTRTITSRKQYSRKLIDENGTVSDVLEVRGITPYLPAVLPYSNTYALFLLLGFEVVKVRSCSISSHSPSLQYKKETTNICILAHPTTGLRIHLFPAPDDYDPKTDATQVSFTVSRLTRVHRLICNNLRNWVDDNFPKPRAMKWGGNQWTIVDPSSGLRVHFYEYYVE